MTHLNEVHHIEKENFITPTYFGVGLNISFCHCLKTKQPKVHVPQPLVNTASFRTFTFWGIFFFSFNAEATQKDLISYLELTDYYIPNKSENIKITTFFFTFQGHETGTQPAFPF